jgi:hypothetical protein
VIRHGCSSNSSSPDVVTNEKPWQIHAPSQAPSSQVSASNDFVPSTLSVPAADSLSAVRDESSRPLKAPAVTDIVSELASVTCQSAIQTFGESKVQATNSPKAKRGTAAINARSKTSGECISTSYQCFVRTKFGCYCSPQFLTSTVKQLIPVSRSGNDVNTPSRPSCSYCLSSWFMQVLQSRASPRQPPQQDHMIQHSQKLLLQLQLHSAPTPSDQNNRCPQP